MVKRRALIYPEGIEKLDAALPLHELITRLEACADYFKGQTDDSEAAKFIPLVQYVASRDFREHNSQYVKLLSASIIADVIRLCAPELPDSEDKLVPIFSLFVDQMEHLNSEDEKFQERAFYLLMSLVAVNSFVVALDSVGNSIIVELFTKFIEIARNHHSPELIPLMVTALSNVINETDAPPDELLQLMASCLMSDEMATEDFCRSIIQKTAAVLESKMQVFFSKIPPEESGKMFLKLYAIAPQNMIQVILNVEDQLKHTDDNRRLEATEQVAGVLSEGSQIASLFPSVCSTFIGRFNDINFKIRSLCVKSCLPLIKNIPEFQEEIIENLKNRKYDSNESVRFQVVAAITDLIAHFKDPQKFSLLEILEQRSLDTNFKVRKAAVLGLGQIYRMFTTGTQAENKNNEWVKDDEKAKQVSWIKIKILHRYHQASLADRIILERLLHTCIVPQWLPSKERSEQLLELFLDCDENARTALIKMLKFQHTYKEQFRLMIDHFDEADDLEHDRMEITIEFMAKQVLNDEAAKFTILEFLRLNQSSPKLFSSTQNLLKANSFEDVNKYAKELLKAMGNPKSSLFQTVKQLLERVGPVLIDSAGISHIYGMIQKGSKGNNYRRGLELLELLASAQPEVFTDESIYQILDLLNSKIDDDGKLLCLKILYQFNKRFLDEMFPQKIKQILPLFLELMEKGTPKHAKYAVRCINKMFTNRVKIFSDAIEHLQSLLVLASPGLEVVLVSLSHISALRSDVFYSHQEAIVIQFVVKKFLMGQHNSPEKRRSRSVIRKTAETSMLKDVRSRVVGIKFLARWLVGLANLYRVKRTELDETDKNSMQKTIQWFAECALRLLVATIQSDGNLLKDKKLTGSEMSSMKSAAGAAILKICSCGVYWDVISQQQFEVLISMVTDPVEIVRETFFTKLHKRLLTLQLPLRFMALLSYGALEENETLQNKIKNYLLLNIEKRRTHLKAKSTLKPSEIVNYLPDYVIVYLIYLLAHDPVYQFSAETGVLNNRIKACLWFQLQFDCAKSNENYSFAYLKKLIETLKRCRDAFDVQNEQMHHRLYAVCDLALGLVMSRVNHFGLRVPGNPLFIPTNILVLDKHTPFNTRYYLPNDMTFSIAEETNQKKRKRTKKNSANYNSESEKEESNDDEEEEEKEEEDDQISPTEPRNSRNNKNSSSGAHNESQRKSLRISEAKGKAKRL